MPFYKKQDTKLLSSEFVDGSGYTLSETGKDEYSYPVDGWYWFANLDDAILAFSRGAVAEESDIQITRRQGRLILLQYGLLDTVETMIANIEDPIQRKTAMVEYESDTWSLNNPTLLSLANQLGLDYEQLKRLFEEAKLL